LTPDAVDLEVGFARTLTCTGEPPVREIATLTLQMIATAARRIYAENQYLTSAAVVRALGERLGAAEGPEVVLVLPAAESGWMEQGSMGLLRQEALAHLRRQDTRARLRLVSPVVSAGGESRAVAVHAKVLVVDEHIMKVGSANFSNRSLGLDSECDLVVDVRDQAGAAFVARVRDRLLGEHLGLEASEVGRRLAAGASLCDLIDGQPPGAARSLVPVPEVSAAAFDFTVLDGAMVDPAEPWSVDGLLERAVPVPLRRRLTRRWLRPLLFAAAVIGVWAILRRGPLRSVHFGAMVLDVAGWLAAQRAGAFLAFAGVALASFLFVPITLLATATLTVFGVWPGVPIAWTGAVLGATLSHAVGVRWGRRAIGWIPARLAAALRRSLGRRAFWSVVLMRLLPVGNFGALNVLAGAFKIPRRSFIIGNAVGLLPGMLGLGVFVNRALAALRHPSVANVGAVAAVAAVVTTLAIVARRRFGAPAMAPSKDVT
jgi:phospholipase D1/2